KYLEDVETPAELPVVMSAARSQQLRWNKGAAENFQKNFRILLQDRTQTAGPKLHGFFHLLNSSFFIVLLVLAILSVPVLYIKNENPQYYWFFNFIAFFTISALIFLICYWVTWSNLHGKSF